MGSEIRDSAVLLAKGTHAQFEFVFNLYPQALGLKSQTKNKKPDELKKLDQWYHNELPKKIQSRAKEGGHLVHEELIQVIKWKLARGKWRPRLKELITMNTPRLVQLETKKAIRQLIKKEDLSSAIQAMCNLKGVGPAMASAVLSCAQPNKIPFMSDECMMALPDQEGSIDYTNKEYLRLVHHVQSASQRLAGNGSSEWTPHKIEQVMFAHHVIAANKPELLQGMPGFSSNGDANGDKAQNGAGDTEQTETDTKANGAASPPELDGVSSAENSRDGAASTSAAELDDNTNDSVASTGVSAAVLNEDANMASDLTSADPTVTSGDVSSNTGDDSNTGDTGLLSGGDDSVSMPPPAVPQSGEATPEETPEATPEDTPEGSPAKEEADGSGKRPAEEDGDDAAVIKRAKPDDAAEAEPTPE